MNGSSSPAVRTMMLVHLVVMFAAIAIMPQNAHSASADEIQSFEQFLGQQTKDKYSTNTVYGIGPEFTLALMHEARFKFALNEAGHRQGNLSMAPLSFYSLNKDLISCRFDGYLDYCDHPFQTAPGHDVAMPFHADFAVADEPLGGSIVNQTESFPLFVLGVSAVFNVPGLNRLVLSRDVLARIFRGCNQTANAACLPNSITTWGHSDIKATNDPTVHSALDAAGQIKVVVRQDLNSATTKTFKRALSSFDSNFAAQIGADELGTWNGTEPISYFGAHGVLYAVKTTPGSITYALTSLVSEQPGLGQVELLNADGDPVAPTTESVFATIQETSLAFGNDGTDPALRRVDLSATKGPRAWPIASMGYLTVRTNLASNLTMGQQEQEDQESCAARGNAMLAFFEYLYTKEQGWGSTLFDGGFAPMTIQNGQQMLDAIRSRLTCNGQLVYQYPPAPPLVTIQTDESLREMISLLGAGFTVTRSANLVIQPLGSHLSIRDRFRCLGDLNCVTNGGFVVLADENLSTYIIRDAQQSEVVSTSAYKLFSMPFCAMATGFIYNLCDVNVTTSTCTYDYLEPLVVSMEVAAGILDEQIIWWNDTAIQDLNPDKVLPQERIRVVAGPKTSGFHFTFIDTMRKTYLPSFAFMGGGHGESTYLEAWLKVNLQPFSFSFVPFNGTSVEGVTMASVVNRQNKVVQPSSASIEACARDTYDPSANVFFLSSSEEPDCWPLVQVFNIFMRNTVRANVAAWLTQYLYMQALRDKTSDAFLSAGGGALQGSSGDPNSDSSTGSTDHTDSGNMNDAAGTVISVSQMGTLVDIQLSDVDLAKRNLDELETVTNIITGARVLRVPHDLTLIPTSLIAVMYALLSLELALYLSLAVWVCIHRNRKLVRNSSPVFMMQVLLGATIMSLTVIPLSQQDVWLVPRGMTPGQLAQGSPWLDGSCVAQPVLFSLGFFLTFSAIFLKSWRLIRIFNNKKLKNLFLKDKQLLAYQAMVLLLVLALNLIWALQDPLVWRRFISFTDDTTNLVVASYGICYSRTGVGPALPLLSGVMIMLILGNYLSYLGRRIPTEFNESKWTAMTMAMTLEACTIGLPVLVLANNQPVPGYIIKSLSCLLVSGATVCLIFLPKVAMAYGWGLVEGESNPWRFVKGESGSGSHGATGKSKDSSKVKGAVLSSSYSKPEDRHQGVKSTNMGPPSLNSLLGLDVKVTTGTLPSGKGATLKRVPSKEQVTPTSETLTKVLKDDPMRRRFRRYLQTLKMEENIRFWDSVLIFRNEPDSSRRFVSARAMIQTFVLDSSPLQVNLSSNTKSEILRAFAGNDKTAMGSIDFFNAATAELFDDLRQSDAFRKFLENDTFSQDDAFAKSRSDPTVVPVGTPT